MNDAYAVLRGAMDERDLDFLRQACQARMEQDGIPCFALIDEQESETYQKIVRLLTPTVGENLHYLNDFYIYTDETFKTNWHMDTELFTFECAVNAWILLSPEAVESPLSFISDINTDENSVYHNVRIEGDQAVFRNYRSGKSETRALSEISASQVCVPRVELGDILVINPKFFHRTTTDVPKHAFSLKLVYGKARNNFLSPSQVPSMFWPEVKMFNDIVAAAPTWDDVVDGIRMQLKTVEGRAQLSSGFYPEKFALYREKVRTLSTEG